MQQAFTALVGATPRIQTSICHRWRYALSDESLTQPCLFDADLEVGLCGDWCSAPRVEGAFLSGSALAGRILGRLG